MKIVQIMDVVCPVCGQHDMTDYLDTRVNSIDSHTVLHMQCYHGKHEERPFRFDVVLHPKENLNGPLRMLVRYEDKT